MVRKNRKRRYNNFFSTCMFILQKKEKKDKKEKKKEKKEKKEKKASSGGITIPVASVP